MAGTRLVEARTWLLLPLELNARGFVLWVRGLIRWRRRIWGIHRYVVETWFVALIVFVSSRRRSPRRGRASLLLSSQTTVLDMSSTSPSRPSRLGLCLRPPCWSVRLRARVRRVLAFCLRVGALVRALHQVTLRVLVVW